MNFLIHLLTPGTYGRAGCINRVLQVYIEQIITRQLPADCYSRPANTAPGSVKAVTGLGG